MTTSDPSLTGSLLPFARTAPAVHASCYVAPGAFVIGDASIGAGSSVWFNAVVRGDVMPITIGERTNIQDLCMLHVSSHTAPTIIGDDVTVGHRAILHGCTVEDGCLIGMGAILLDGVHVGAGSLIAAGALVPPNMQIPPNSFVVGSPARIKRETTPEERAFFLKSAAHYAELAASYKAGGGGDPP